MEEKNYNFYMQTNLSEFIGQWVNNLPWQGFKKSIQRG